MRRIVLVAALAACLGSPAGAQIFPNEIRVDLNTSDPKYNSAECAKMRMIAKNYNNGTLGEQAGSFVLGMGAPGGGFAATMAQYRKREMVQYQVEKACMSNPPDRRYLEPGSTVGR